MKNYKIPKEHLFAIISNSKISLDLLSSLPNAISSAIKSIPMPWNINKVVDVVYSKNGNICFIDDNEKITEKKFKEYFSTICNLENDNNQTLLLSYPIYKDINFLYNTLSFNHHSLSKGSKSIFPVYDKLKVDLKGRKKYKKHFYYEIKLSKTLRKKEVKMSSVNTNECLIKPEKYSLVSTKFKLKDLLETKYYLLTEMLWLEGVFCILCIGKKLLNFILRTKDITSIVIDSNFNLIYNRKLTTKEKKKSSLGRSFHLTRELLKLLKYVYDLFYHYQTGNLKLVDLCTNLDYIFSNVGTLTEMYKYKYKIMNQIKITKKSKYSVKWTDSWRVWVYMLRGYVPLLRKSWENYILRSTTGRKEFCIKETEQRRESNIDIKIKRSIRDRLGENKINEQIFDKMWKAWKSGKCYPLSIPEKNTTDVLNKHLQERIKLYFKDANKKLSNNSKERKKQLGKLLRLYFHNKLKSNNNFLSMIEYDKIFNLLNNQKNAEENISSYSILYKKCVTEINKNFFIKLPTVNDLSKYSYISCLEIRKYSTDKVTEWINDVDKPLPKKAYKNILYKRSFTPLTLKIRYFTTPIFYYHFDDNYDLVTNTFLSHYLNDQIEKYQNTLCPKINNFVVYEEFITAYLENRNENIIEFYQYEGILDLINLNLLRMILCQVMDKVIVDYIIAATNCKVVCKEMEYINMIGVVKGLSFASQIQKLFYIGIDKINLTLMEGSFIYKYLNKLFIVNSKTETTFKEKSFIFVKSITSEECLEMNNIKEYFIPSILHYEDVSKKLKFIFKNTHGKSFISIIENWNYLLISFLQKLKFSKNSIDIKFLYSLQVRVENSIKRGINSKMPSRYPLALFYAPKSIGGLGMFSVKLLKKEGYQVPSILNYCNDNYKHKETIENYLIPHRTKKAIIKHYELKKMVDLEKYEIDCIEGLKGVESIYKFTLHSMLRSDCEIKDIWESGEYKGFTKAQKSTHIDMGNRKFILWWSPILNRSNVFTGYKYTIEKTGVVMHGRLNNLKKFYVSIFRQGLWDRIENEFINLLEKSLNKKLFKATVIWGDFDQVNESYRSQLQLMSNTFNQPIKILLDLSFLKYHIEVEDRGKYKNEIEKLNNVIIEFISTNKYIVTLVERTKTILGISGKNSCVFDIELCKYDLLAELNGDSLYLFNPKNGNLYYKQTSVKINLIEYLIEFTNIMKYSEIVVDKQIYSYLNRKIDSLPGFKYKIIFNKIYLCNYYKHKLIKHKKVHNVYNKENLTIKEFYDFIDLMKDLKNKFM